MRKVLISILVILLIVLAYFTIFQGISIGNFEILSASGIVGLNDELTAKIEEANRKIKNDLQSKRTELSQSGSTLLQNKESYYRVANVSTESETSKANTQETYDIEYLWLRIGRHARTEGVNIRMDVMNGTTGDENTKNLSFTVIGQYVAIIDFVSSIEDDSELAFRIENFNLLPDGTNLKATFDITGIRIKIENTTQSVSGTNNETAAEGTATPDGATNTEATTTGTSSANTIDTNTTTQGS